MTDCRAYAQAVDIDGASAKAARYWLFGGRPEKALASSEKALKVGQNYAALYAAEALAILGRSDEAKRQWQRFVRKVPDHRYAFDDIDILKKLYPKVDFDFMSKDRETAGP